MNYLYLNLVTVAIRKQSTRGTARKRRSSPPATVSGNGNEPRASPQHPEHTVITNWTHGRSYRLRRWPWRCGGAARRQDAGAGRDCTIKVPAEPLLTTTKLIHTLARQVVVGDELATATGHGGGRTARSARGTTAHRAILARNAGAVTR